MIANRWKCGCGGIFPSKNELWSHMCAVYHHQFPIHVDDFKFCELRYCAKCISPQIFTFPKKWRPKFTRLYSTRNIIYCLFLARLRSIFACLPRDIFYIIVDYTVRIPIYRYRAECDSCRIIISKAIPCYHCYKLCYTIGTPNYNDVQCSECKLDMRVCIRCTDRLCRRCKEYKKFRL